MPSIGIFGRKLRCVFERTERLLWPLQSQKCAPTDFPRLCEGRVERERAIGTDHRLICPPEDKQRHRTIEPCFGDVCIKSHNPIETRKGFGVAFDAREKTAAIDECLYVV